MLKLDENKLILSSELVMLLQANPGDKIAIEYASKDGKLIPVILKSEHGNLLTKSNTVSFKGKQRSSLIQFGTEFNINITDNTLELVGNKPNVVYSFVPTVVEEPLDKSIILDTNYDIQKFTKYEF